MKQSVGMTHTLNIIIIFIIISFAILAAIMSYSKAYRISSKIINQIEICEGYNICASNEIDRILTGLGYSQTNNVNNCPKREDSQGKEIDAISRNDNNFDYCIYKLSDNTSIQGSEKYCFEKQKGCGYDQYEVITYMIVDFPLIDQIKIPIKNRTDWIYRFPNDRQ